MDTGVFLCKFWQYGFGSTWKHYISSLFSSNMCYFVQPPLESSKQMSDLLYFFLSFKMCSTVFTETFMFKFPSVWVSVLKANPLLEQIQPLTFSTFSLALCTSLPFLSLCTSQKKLPLYSPSNTIIVPLDVLCHLCLLNSTQNLVLILGFLQLSLPMPIQCSL